MWKEDKFTVRPAAGIGERKKRLADLWAGLSRKLALGKWACTQARELWSTKELVSRAAAARSPASAALSACLP